MENEMEQWITEMLRIGEEDQKMTAKQIKIVQAAIETFAEKGYAASSTSEIAQKAGVAEGTIFRHYKTKKELLFSIVGPTLAKLIAPFVLKSFTQVLETPYLRFEDFLRAAIQNRMEFVRNHLPIVKIMLHEIPFQPELLMQLREHVVSKVSNRLQEIVVHFQKEGQLAALPPKATIRLAVSVIIGFLLTRFLLMPDLPWDEAQETELSVEFIMHGLSPLARNVQVDQQ